MLSQKNGSILDVFFIIGIFLLFLTATIFSYHMWNQTKTKLLDQAAPTIDLAATNAKIDSTFLLVDNLLVVLYISFTLMSAIGAYFIDSHPVFFVFSLIALIILIGLSAVFSNVFESLLSKFTEYSSFSKGMYIVSNLPLYAGVSGVLILVALYAKPRGGF